MKRVILVGNPNVGKSVLFYLLTGNYVTVSNYPGTTVEVSRGVANLYGKALEIYDTPGLYSLDTITEEEAVTKRLLSEKKPDLVIHVTDAKNLPRMLPLTLELQQLGFPLLLLLNMMDEADRAGVRIRRHELSSRLHLPVLEAALAQGRGVAILKREISRMISEGEKAAFSPERKGRTKNVAGAGTPAAFLKWQEAERILSGVYFADTNLQEEGSFDRFTLSPAGGMILTLSVLYFGLYLLVGRFGAGILVDLLEGTLISEMILPILARWSAEYAPWPELHQLLAGEYGIITLGFRYAFGIILPIMGTFFFVFSVLEDSGILPRLAYLTDGWMNRLGLNGRAVIPLTLGLGCGTMAVLVTRTLESKRERVIASFLLALAVPCSAQLGLIMALLSGRPASLLLWAVITGGVLILAGSLLEILLPGHRAPFFMELPPLRLPRFNAIFQKTLARMRWYFVEVIPVFMLVSIFLWLMQMTGLMDTLAALLAPALGRMGLPPEMNLVFLYGFFRRDYGAAGLYDLYKAGKVAGAQLLVASVVLTLFLPCLAQLVMMVKERGVWISLVIAVSVIFMAYGAGVLLRGLLGLPVL